MADAPGDITTLLHAMRDGDELAADTLMNRVMEELRVIAAQRAPRQGGTLQATVLVNECYLRLADRDVPFRDRKHFFSLASLAMRDIAVEYARRNAALKRGGGALRETLRDCADDGALPLDDVAACADAVAKIQGIDAAAYEVVMYRFYAGLPNRLIAELMDIPEIKVRRLWQLAQVLLLEILDDDESESASP